MLNDGMLAYLLASCNIRRSCKEGEEVSVVEMGKSSVIDGGQYHHPVLVSVNLRTVRTGIRVEENGAESGLELRLVLMVR